MDERYDHGGVFLMARVGFTGFDTQSVRSEFGGVSLATGMTFDTGIFRTGLASLKNVAPSGANNSTTYIAASAGRHLRVYVRVTVLPASTARVVAGNLSASNLNVRLNPSGTLALYNNTTLLGTSTTALTDTTRWYCVEVRSGTISADDLLRIDGISEVVGSITTLSIGGVVGANDTVADTYTAYYDDMSVDDATWCDAGKVVLLLPISDNARSAGWVGGGGATTSLFDAVNNTPPVGVADTGTNTSQIRNATAEANGSYDANLTTYSTAGLVAGDTVNAVLPIVCTAAPVTTGAKLGTVGVASNPTIANVALASGGTPGAFWSGATAGTFGAGWKYSSGTLTTSPSVTLGTSPVMRITQSTSSTRIADVCFMGMYVDYTPAAVARVPYVNQMPPLLAQ